MQNPDSGEKTEGFVTGLNGDDAPLLACAPKTLHSSLIQGKLWEQKARNPPQDTPSRSNKGTSTIRAPVRDPGTCWPLHEPEQPQPGSPQGRDAQRAM